MGALGAQRVGGVDPPTERTSIRVILLDAADRVLLLGARDPDDGRTVWFMPGGGVEPGEQLQDKGPPSAWKVGQVKDSVMLRWLVVLHRA